MKRVLSFLFGFVVGGLVGLALAVLFAPVSGEALFESFQGRFQEAIKEGRIGVVERRLELEQELEAAKRA